MYRPSSFNFLSESEVKKKVHHYSWHGYQNFLIQSDWDIRVDFHIATIGLPHMDKTFQVVVSTDTSWIKKGYIRALCLSPFSFEYPGKVKNEYFGEEVTNLVNELITDDFFLQGKEVLVYKFGDSGQTIWKSYSKEVPYINDRYSYESETIVGTNSTYIPPQPIKRFIYICSKTAYWPKAGF